MCRISLKSLVMYWIQASGRSLRASLNMRVQLNFYSGKVNAQQTKPASMLLLVYIVSCSVVVGNFTKYQQLWSDPQADWVTMTRTLKHPHWEGLLRWGPWSVFTVTEEVERVKNAITDVNICRIQSYILFIITFHVY